MSNQRCEHCQCLNNNLLPKMKGDIGVIYSTMIPLHNENERVSKATLLTLINKATVNKFIASGKRCERFASNFIYIIWKQIWLSENCIALPRTISSRFNFLLCLHTTFRLMKWIAMDAQARFSNVEMLLFFLRPTWQYTLSWLKCYVRLDPTSQFTNDDDGRK